MCPFNCGIVVRPGLPITEWVCPCGHGYWDAVAKEFITGEQIRDGQAQSKEDYEAHLRICECCLAKAEQDSLIAFDGDDRFKHYFLPKSGISFEVAAKNIDQYLGSPASIRPGANPKNGKPGYIIYAKTAPTTQTISDLIYRSQQEYKTSQVKTSDSKDISDRSRRRSSDSRPELGTPHIRSPPKSRDTRGQQYHIQQNPRLPHTNAPVNPQEHTAPYSQNLGRQNFQAVSANVDPASFPTNLSPSQEDTASYKSSETGFDSTDTSYSTTDTNYRPLFTTNSPLNITYSPHNTLYNPVNPVISGPQPPILTQPSYTGSHQQVVPRNSTSTLDSPPPGVNAQDPGYSLQSLGEELQDLSLGHPNVAINQESRPEQQPPKPERRNSDTRRISRDSRDPRGRREIDQDRKDKESGRRSSDRDHRDRDHRDRRKR